MADESASSAQRLMEELDASIEHTLGLPASFLQALLAEDDWSFVIKLHALCESALAHHLTNRLAAPSLGESIAKLNTSGGRASKIGFAEALGLITDDQVKYLRRMSELRNSVVHDVRNASFTFAGLRAKMGDAAFAAHLEPFFYFQKAWPPAKFARPLDGSPKFGMYWGALGLVTTAYSNVLEAKVAALIPKMAPSSSKA